MTRNLVFHVPTRCSWEQRGVLMRGSRSMVATCWSRERPGSFLRARDFLAALLLPRWHLTERVPPRGHAPWSHGAFLRRRRPGRRRSFVARAERGAAERTAQESPLWRGRAQRRGRAMLRRRRRRDGSAGARLPR